MKRLAAVSVGRLRRSCRWPVLLVRFRHRWKNCAAMNRKYPHSIGKFGARDRTAGDRVTDFKRSNRLYALAMSYNRGLDRDHDGIACEKL